MELLIGCGNSRVKQMHLPDAEQWQELVTLDMMDDCKADIVHDLNVLPYPFTDEKFDEIHAYDVLEHCGKQGDWRFFFDQWSEFWRILKPAGLFFGACPAWDSEWAWGDPSHTRIISQSSLVFLSQRMYQNGVGKGPMSDYRSYYHADFELVYTNIAADKKFRFTLRKC